VNIQTFSTITSSVVVLAFLLAVSEFRFKLGAIYLLIGLASLLALFIAVNLSNESIVEVLRFSPTANILPKKAATTLRSSRAVRVFTFLEETRQ
jgi:hypothetical protein